MRTLFITFGLLLISFLGQSQLTLAIQDFESPAATPTYTYSNSGGSISSGNGLYPSDPMYSDGSKGYKFNNVTGSLTFSSIDVSAYSSIELSFRLASFASTSGNGADGTDYVQVLVSIDGGVTFSNELKISGNNNAKWSFATGTGIATASYDGDNSPTTISPGGGGNRTSDGYSTIKVQGLPNSSSLVIKVEFENNHANETWVVDEVKLIGANANNGDSKAEVPTIQVSSVSVPSTVQLASNAVDVFKFKVHDLGTGDGKPTKVTRIRIKKNSGSQLLDDWLKGFTLKDGSTNISIASIFMASDASYFDININSGDLDIADGGSLELTLGVYFEASVVDNQTFSFYIDADDNGFSASSFGSGFDPDFGADIISNTITITVAATKMIFSQQPTTTIINQAMIPSPIVSYVDADENVDLDISGAPYQVTMSSSGTLSGSATTAVNPVSGIATFSNIIHSATSTVIYLSASSASGVYSSINSSNFNITLLTVNPMVDSLYISEVSEGPSVNTEFLELFNPSSSPISLSDIILHRLSTSGAEEYSIALSSLTGDKIIDKGGYWVISRGADRDSFESAWSSFPSSSGFMTGNNSLYFGAGNARRWRITYDDGTKTVITIDDTQAAVGGSGNNSNQITPGSWTTTNSISNATPGFKNTLSFLPIELISFSAQSFENQVQLNWQTASETNNDYFTIERSVDAEDFEKIGVLTAAGNSNVIQNYQYIDKDNPLNEFVYYRLKQTDFDGKFSYSNTISLHVLNKTTQLINYFVESHVLHLQIMVPNEEIMNIELLDLTGRIVHINALHLDKGNNEYKIRLDNLPAGVYILRVSSSMNSITEKVFIN